MRDPITGNPVNAASGDCVDCPGAYVPPPPPANVVSSNFGPLGLGGWALVTFDAPVILAAGATPDDAITFIAIYVATAVYQSDPFTVYFALSTSIYTGSPRDVGR